ncbi:hypothetical protein KR093_007927, partial [Drosophila rubida]
TTIMAVEYDGGVALAADSRTTSQSFVVNRVADKLTKVTDKIYCCCSGSVSQGQQLSQMMSNKFYSLSITMGDSLLVQMAASAFRQRVYLDRSFNQTSVIVAGWDKFCGGQVYVITASGLMVRLRAAASGSGASVIRSYLLAKHRNNIKLNNAIDLLKNAIEIAISQDPHSGGVVRIGVINKNGL